MAQLALSSGAMVAMAATSWNPIAEAAVVAGAAIAGAVIDSYWLYPALRADKKDKRPDINDSPFDNGAPCPHAIGRVRVPAQIIWAGDPMFNYDDEGKAKGSDSDKPQSVKRHIAIAFHRGPIDDADLVEKIFANGTAVYKKQGITDDTALITPNNYLGIAILEIKDYSNGDSYQYVNLSVFFTTDAEGKAAFDKLKNTPWLKFNPAGASNIGTVAYPPDGTVMVTGVTTPLTDYTLIDIQFWARKVFVDSTGTPVTLPTLTIADFTTGGVATMTANEAKPKKYFDGDPSTGAPTIYTGDFEQSADPLISSYMPLVDGFGTTPAYRGTAYLVMEAFNCTEWGGTLPQFEVLFSTTASLPVNAKTAVINILDYNGHSDLLNSLRYYAEYSESYIPEFQGIFWQGPTPAIQKIQDIELIAHFNMYEGFQMSSDGQTIWPTLEFTGSERYTSYADVSRNIIASEATCRPANELGVIEPTIMRTPVNDAPNAMAASFLNADNNNLSALITHQTVMPDAANFVTRNDITTKFPFALTTQQAQAYAIEIFWRAQLQKDSIEFQLPPTYYDLTVGDTINCTLHNVQMTARVAEIERGANGLIIAKTSIDDGRSFGQLTQSSNETTTDTGNLAPRLIVVEVPPLFAEDVDKLVVYACVVKDGGFPSTGYQISFRLLNTQLWLNTGTVRNSVYASYNTTAGLALQASTNTKPVVDNQLISINNQAAMPVGSSAELSDATDGLYRYYFQGELIGVGNESDPNVTQLIRGMNGSTADVLDTNGLVVHMPITMSGWQRIVLENFYQHQTIAFNAALPGSDPLFHRLAVQKYILGTSLKYPGMFNLMSTRRNGVALEITCYMQGPRPTDALGSSTVTASELATKGNPFVWIVDDAINQNVYRTIEFTYVGNATWKLSYSSANQRADYGTGGTDPTDIAFVVSSRGTIPKETVAVHTGNDNYLFGGGNASRTKQAYVLCMAASGPLIINEVFYRSEAFIKVKDSTLTAPPASPATGDAYLVRTASPTGAWTGMSGCIVFWFGSHWCVVPPITGLRTYCVASSRMLLNTGSTTWYVHRGFINNGNSGASTVTPDLSTGSVFRIAVTGSFTLNFPSNALLGVVTTFLIENTSGSTFTMTFQSGSWISSVTSVSLANNKQYAFRATKHPTESRMYAFNANTRDIHTSGP